MSVAVRDGSVQPPRWGGEGGPGGPPRQAGDQGGPGGPPRQVPATPVSLVRDGVPRAAIVALACVCAFMVVVDSSIVNVALPSIRDALHLSNSTQQWVVDAYLLTLGGFMLLGARLTDMFGRRRVLAVGIVVFMAASLAGGLAQSGPALLAARAVQGIGGSILAPSGLALIIASVPDGAARGKAMSLYAATGSVAATIGVLLGGVLTQALSWRWVMFINVPVGIGLVVAVARLLAPHGGGERRGRLDAPGAVLVTLGVGALIEGVSHAESGGWGSGLTVGAIGAAVVLLVGFVLVEHRAATPLVRLSVLRLPGVAAGNLVIACVGTALTGSTFFLSLILQSALGYGALATGLRLAPLAVAVGALSLLSPRLTERFGPRRVLIAGLLVAAAGYGWVGVLPAHPSYGRDLLAPLIVIGTGLGLTIMPSVRAAAAGIPASEAGLAAGLFNVSRQIGAAVGIAALVTVAVTRTSARSAAGHAAVASLRGDALALVVCGGMCLVAAGIAATLLTASPARTG